MPQPQELHGLRFGKMRKKIKILLVGLALVGSSLAITGCSTKQRVPALPADSSTAGSQGQHQVISKLYAHLEEWHGVPHRDGGMGKQGIDCSGFTALTLRRLFDVRLPRTTSQQANSGTTISRLQLRPGDLVFFKIRMGVRHVGIYVEEQKFMHASKSRGVMLSRLDNPYWLEHYWQARRVAALSIP